MSIEKVLINQLIRIKKENTNSRAIFSLWEIKHILKLWKLNYSSVSSAHHLEVRVDFTVVLNL